MRMTTERLDKRVSKSSQVVEGLMPPVSHRRLIITPLTSNKCSQKPEMRITAPAESEDGDVSAALHKAPGKKDRVLFGGVGVWLRANGSSAQILRLVTIHVRYVFRSRSPRRLRSWTPRTRPQIISSRYSYGFPVQTIVTSSKLLRILRFTGSGK
jgi:hypothetical protein